MAKQKKEIQHLSSGRDVMKVIRLYNTIVDMTGSKKLLKLSSNYSTAKTSRFYKGFDLLTYNLKEEKLDAMSYISLTVRKLLNTYKNSNKKIYPSFVTSQNMFDQYLESYGPKIIEQEQITYEDREKKLEWMNNYIDMIKSRMKKNWGDKYDKMVNSYQFKSWEAQVKGEIYLFEGM
jgi:hypothetical protein